MMEDADTCASSPMLVSFVGRRRRHSQGWHRAWTPSPHFPGLGHNMNPIPYPPTTELSSTPYSGPHPSGGSPSSILCASSANCHPVSTSPIYNMQAAAPQVQANVVNIPACPLPNIQETLQYPPLAPVVMAGGAPDPMPPPIPWVCTGFHDGF